jgi:hypothetical protein
VSSREGSIGLPFRIVRLRRPRSDWLHLELRTSGTTEHFGALLEPPLRGIYLLDKAPLSGLQPHGSQATLRHRCEGRNGIAAGLAPGLLELHLDDGSVVSICWRRKGAGVRWRNAAQLAVDDEAELSGLDRVCPDALEAARDAVRTEGLRSARRKQLERAIERQRRAFEQADPDALAELAERASALRHELTISDATLNVPAYDSVASADQVALKKTEKKVSEVIDRLFHQARRARRRRVQASAQIEKMKAEIEGLEQAVFAPPEARRGSSESALGPGIKRFSLASGREILVGGSAAANHRLTFAIARGSDFWFHARDVPGPHVILRCRRDEVVPDGERRLAAATALRLGGLRGGGAQDVRCAQRRYLDSVRGAVGSVLVRQEQVLRVDPESAELRAALDALAQTRGSS